MFTERCDYMDTLYKLNDYIEKQNNIKICSCGNKMNYSLLNGTYICPNCNFIEKDLYGKIKNLVENNPNLSKIEISIILDIPIRTLNKYIQNGYIVNPKSNF